MEGVVGSRLGRASSRYGAPTVFNGPVRKWRKQWVHVSYHNNNTNSQSNVNASSLLLCRWTPITPTDAGEPDKDSGGKLEVPPRKKFRYTPIVVLEEQKKEVARKIDNEAKSSKRDEFTASPVSKSDEIHEKPSLNYHSVEDNQAPNSCRSSPQQSEKSNLDLGLCLKGHNDAHDHPDGKIKGAQLGRANSGGFWALG